METQHQHNYKRIEEAIGYIISNFKQQPSLDEIAGHVHMSPAHFQRIFSDWAGTSPKKFLQYISLEHAKKILSEQRATLFDTAFETGLSSTSRLHELFVKIEGMTPAEYKNGGSNLAINYQTYPSPFGKILVASTPKGICHMAFTDDEEKEFQTLQMLFPRAQFVQQTDEYHRRAQLIFNPGLTDLQSIKLHIRGTAFQLKVWQSLLKVPSGTLATYGNIAAHVGQPLASRAVGSAIGRNPVAYLIPCHRVIQASGVLGNYMWGKTRKVAIFGWEQALHDS